MVDQSSQNLFDFKKHFPNFYRILEDFDSITGLD